MNNFNEDQLADLEKYQNLWDTHWEILSSLFLERFQGMFQERQSIEILRKHFLQFVAIFFVFVKETNKGSIKSY